MYNNKTLVTALTVIAAIFICGFSIVSINKIMNKEVPDSTEVSTQAPVTQTTQPPATQSPVTEVSGTLPTAGTTAPPMTTLPVTTLPVTTEPSTAPPVQTTQPSTQTPVTSATTGATNTTTDQYIQEAAKTSSGFLDYSYNPTGNYYYTSNDPWQRRFGFNSAYDTLAQFIFFYYDTARIYFDYMNKNWMIELWKGQYGGVFLGGEIGVYYKNPEREIQHFDCVSNADAIRMQMSLYRDGTKEPLFTTEDAYYWWCTGFVPGKLNKVSDRSELTMKARLRMKNETMLKAFTGGLESCKEFEFRKGKNFTVEGLDVFITWK